MGYGIGGFLGICKQNSFGTANTSSYEYVPIISESLTTELEDLVSENIQNRYEEGESYSGLLSVAGDIVFEPHPTLFGHFLRGCLGPGSSTLVGSVYTHTFVPAQKDFDVDKCALPPYTIVAYRNNGQAWQFSDAQINNLSLEVAAGAIVRCTANVIARVSSTVAAPTASFQTGQSFLWSQGSYSLAGGANTDLENVTFSVENNVEAVSLIDGNNLASKFKRTTYRNFGVSGSMDFSVQSEYMKFRAGSEQAAVLTLTGETLTTSQSAVIKLDVPRLRYTSFPTGLTGPGRQSVGFEGKGKYLTSSGTAMRVTLVNTKAAY